MDPLGWKTERRRLGDLRVTYQLLGTYHSSDQCGALCLGGAEIRPDALSGDFDIGDGAGIGLFIQR